MMRHLRSLERRRTAAFASTVAFLAPPRRGKCVFFWCFIYIPAQSPQCIFCVICLVSLRCTCVRIKKRLIPLVFESGMEMNAWKRPCIPCLVSQRCQLSFYIVSFFIALHRQGCVISFGMSVPEVPYARIFLTALLHSFPFYRRPSTPSAALPPLGTPLPRRWLARLAPRVSTWR